MAKAEASLTERLVPVPMPERQLVSTGDIPPTAGRVRSLGVVHRGARLFMWGREESADRMIVAVLRGKKHVLEIMDAGGDGVFANVTHFHRDTVRSQYFNAIAAAALRAFADSRPGRQTRVLEVGAGVGGTTGAALEALPAQRSTYHFTDLSSAFFSFAREQFGRYGWVRYGTYDMNTDPATCGLERSSFDAVLGANAVHCARELKVTLTHLCRLLVPGGILVLRELTAPRPAHAMIPGLIPGFSDYRDQRSEVGSPLLSIDDWCCALEATRFDAVCALPHPQAASLGEHLILARRSDD